MRKMPYCVVLSLLVLSLLVSLGSGAVAGQGAAAIQVTPEAAPWEGEAFNTPAAEMLRAALALPQEGDDEVDLLYWESEFQVEEGGRLSRRSRRVYRVLKASALEEWARVSVPWAPWFEARPEVRARVITAEGGEHWLDAKNLDEAPAQDASALIFTDDRVLQAPLPGVGVGSIVELEITATDDTSFFAAGRVVTERFFLPRIRHGRVLLETPDSLPVRVATRLLPEERVDETVAVPGGRTRRTFDLRDFEPEYRFVPGLPPEEAAYPYLAFSTGESWNAVARAYGRVVDETLAGVDLSAEVARFRSSAVTPRQMLAEMLTWVQGKVRYTGVEFGEASIVPRNPTETLERGFGDCKDKATLMVALLRQASIPAYVALLRAGFGTDVEADLPGLGAFNHAIVYIPAGEVEDDPVWIDATEELARPDQLPTAARDRRALIAASFARALTTTPAPSSADSRVVEEREIFLSTYGPARVVETNEFFGLAEIDARRNFGDASQEDLEEWAKGYAAETYLADRVTRVEATAIHDFSTPYRLRLEAAEARRGFTELDQAVAAIRVEALLGRVPDVFFDAEGEAREEPFLFYQPHTAEWIYTITPPAGFVPRKLPPSETRTLASARLEQEFSAGEDGTVRAVFRFDSGPRRLSPEEFEALRKELSALATADAVVIYFDLPGSVHLAAGRVPEALAEFRRLALAEPDEALHAIRISRALLAAGLGQAARQAAARAVRLAPELALAHNNLGWILQHDEIGRLRGPGFDRAGALVAYREVRRLDPEDHVAWADLAILLEFDEKGRRYQSSDEDLAEAGDAYRALVEDENLTSLSANLLSNLFWRRDFPAMASLAREPPDSPNQVTFLATAVAMTEGAEAAIREVQQRLRDPGQRSTALAGASLNALRLRRYAESGALMTAAANGSANPVQVLAMGKLFGEIRPWEKGLAEKATSPGAPFFRLLRAILVPGVDATVVRDVFSRNLTLDAEEMASLPDDLAELREVLTLAFAELDAPPEVILDVVMSVVEVDAEGNDETGYRVLLRSRADGQTFGPFFILKEEGTYRILAGFEGWSEMGSQILDLLEAGRTEASRQWLDWAWDVVGDGSAEDACRQPPFRLLWKKEAAVETASPGSTGSVDGTGSADGPDPRLAAAVLLGASDEPERLREILPEILAAREGAEAKPALALDLALLRLYHTLDEDEVALGVIHRLLERCEDSSWVRQQLASVQTDLGRPDDARRTAQAALERFPDELWPVRILTDLAAREDRFDEAWALFDDLIARGKARSIDYNNLAWYELVSGDTTRAALEHAEQAARLSEYKDRSRLHTLATAYAEGERPVEAYQAILLAADSGPTGELAPEDWYVIGRLAEIYGFPDLAREYYGRVGDLKEPSPPPLSTLVLAQRRFR